MAYFLVRDYHWAGSEGNYYIIVLNHLNGNLTVYKGNFYKDSQDTLEKLYSIAPFAEEFFRSNKNEFKFDSIENWEAIRFQPALKNYVFIPSIIKKTVVEKWNSHTKEGSILLDILFNGLFYACEKHNRQLSDMIMKQQSKQINHNALRSLVETYPHIWKQPHALKLTLEQNYGFDKLHRNLICLCADERIPDELDGELNISDNKRDKLIDRLVDA